MFGALLLEGKQQVSPFYRDLHLLKLGSDFHERNVDESFAQSRQQLGARDFHHCKQRGSPFYHDLGLDLVGMIGNFVLVEQLTYPSGCRATSEPNSFSQSCFKEIFGRRPR